MVLSNPLRKGNTRKFPLIIHTLWTLRTCVFLSLQSWQSHYWPVLYWKLTKWNKTLLYETTIRRHWRVVNTGRISRTMILGVKCSGWHRGQLGIKMSFTGLKETEVKIWGRHSVWEMKNKTPENKKLKKESKYSVYNFFLNIRLISKLGMCMMRL